MMEKKYLSEKEVAVLTGRAVPTLRKDRHYGRGLPYCKVGRLVRYLLQDVDAYMLSCRIVPHGAMGLSDAGDRS
ncbi:MAG: helix-turn-helix transcriptional regulator [Desulfobulbia bacterium]